MTIDHSIYRWHKTNAPVASSRTDDVWMVTDMLGWAVNSNGQILKTTDGFESFVVQAHFPDVYLRCVSFANELIGWVGSVAAETPDDRLFVTRDGGETWSRVTNLPAEAPARICGLYVVDDQTVFASGSNYPNEPTGCVRSEDGCATWEAVGLQSLSTLLVDIYFRDRSEGWIVGGEDAVKHPDRSPVRDDVIPVVLHTIDGGRTWENQLAKIRQQFPRGEWGWKIQETPSGVMFVSLENLRDGAILRSDNRGITWTRLRINDSQRNSNLEGIGFIDDNVGWVGGWGDLVFKGGFSSKTIDGGKTWHDANDTGFRLNRFRFLGSPINLGFASGDTIYRYEPKASEDGGEPASLGEETVLRPSAFIIPQGAKRLQLDVWERFGRRVGQSVEENPSPGSRSVDEALLSSLAETDLTGEYLVRATVDGESSSFYLSPAS